MEGNGCLLVFCRRRDCSVFAERCFYLSTLQKRSPNDVCGLTDRTTFSVPQKT